MASLVRVVLTFVTAVGVYFITSIVLEIAAAGSTALQFVLFPVELAAGFFAGRFVWRRLESANGGLLQTVGLGALVTGGVGFVGGFVGPMILTPDANQGPMLGIFITGPLGFIVGGIGGAVVWFLRRNANPAPTD